MRAWMALRSWFDAGAEAVLDGAVAVAYRRKRIICCRTGDSYAVTGICLDMLLLMLLREVYCWAACTPTRSCFDSPTPLNAVKQSRQTAILLSSILDVCCWYRCGPPYSAAFTNAKRADWLGRQFRACASLWLSAI